MPLMPDPYITHTNFVNSVLEEKFKEGKVKHLYVPEILEGVDDNSKLTDKQKILLNNASKPLLELLRLTYDPNITFTLTGEEVEKIEPKAPMDIPDYDTAPSNIFTEARRFRLFTNESDVPISKERQIRMLEEMFSAMHPDEVDLIKQMFARKLKVNGLTEKLVRKCFPRLLGPEKPKATTKKSANKE